MCALEASGLLEQSANGHYYAHAQVLYGLTMAEESLLPACLQTVNMVLGVGRASMGLVTADVIVFTEDVLAL